MQTQLPWPVSFPADKTESGFEGLWGLREISKPKTKISIMDKINEFSNIIKFWSTENDLNFRLSYSNRKYLGNLLFMRSEEKRKSTLKFKI